MKKGKTRKLTRRILSIVLTVALVVGLMPGNMLTVSAEGIEAGKSEEIVVETVSSNDASAMTECTCETDDPAFHATNCPAYIAPENPQCTCAEKCTEDTLNIWCDVCGVQGVSACQGDFDSATSFATTTTVFSDKACGASTNEGGAESVTCTFVWDFADTNNKFGILTISGSGAMEDDTPHWWARSKYDYRTPEGNAMGRTINKVIVEEGITHIGDFAFYGCTYLDSVSLPSTLKSIGDLAFTDCPIETIDIPSGVTSIGQSAFNGCSNLTSITIPEGVKYIERQAFQNCSSLTSVTIPDGVIQIGMYAFVDCTGLQTVSIPSSIQNIGNDAFKDCTSLKTVNVPCSWENNPLYTFEEGVTVNIAHHNRNANGACIVCKDGYATEPNKVSSTHYPELNDTHSGYYAIETMEQLCWFSDYVNKGNTSVNAVLTDDIVAGANDIWTPIGNDTNIYAGTFDGNNHTISGLYTNNELARYVGLFGTISGTVKNVGVTNVSFSGTYSVGGVCGENRSGTIQNCYSTGSITNGDQNAGGVCGFNGGTIQNCHSECIVEGASFVGGVCGYNNGTIQNCYSTGSITNGDQNAGGVCGTNSNPYGSITNCYYLNGTCSTGIGGDGQGTAESKTENEFNSGAVAYLLNNSTSTGNLAWYQNLSDNTDSYPVLNDTHGTVYSVYKCDGTTIYRNVNENMSHIPNYSASGKTITASCSQCSQENIGTIVISASNKYYDGTAIIATVDNSVDGTDYSSSIVYMDNTGTKVDGAVNVGIYTANLTLTNADSAEVTASVEFTIDEKAITVTADNESKTYGEDDTELTYTITDGTLENGETLTGTLVRAEGEDVGTYAITQGTLTNENNPNYDITFVEGTFTIEKAEATITVSETEYYKTFGDADFTLDITDDNPEANVTYSSNDENVVTVSNGTVTIKGAGSTTITVSMGASTNYNAAVDKTVTVNVARAAYSVDTINKSYLYARSNADSINLAELLPEDCGTVNYASVTSNGPLTFTSEPKVTNGILAYTLESGAADDTGIIVVDVETQNYEDITITVNVTLIDQIPVNVDGEVELNSNILTYGETLSGLTFKSVDFVDNAGNEVEGTLAWKEPSATPDAGTTSAKWVFTPNNAEYASVEGTVAITVNKATPNVTGVPTVADRVYNPSVVLADSDMTGGTVKGVDGNSLAGSWSWQSTNVVPVVNKSGYIAVFTPTDSRNYETVTRTITVNVAKATPYVMTAPTATAITYGKTLNESALSGGTVQYSETDETAVAGSWSWKEETTKPVVADSNVTQYDVVFTPTDAENYNKVETKITLTVNKAETTPNMPESTMNVLYSKKTVSAVKLPEDWVWNEADAEKELTVDVAVEATAIYNGVDKGNYVTESVTISITRQACDHEESDILYTGEGEKAPTCTVDGIGHTECTKCQEPMQTNVIVEATGHIGETEVKDAKKATCAVDGYTGDTYCKDCGAKIATGTKIAKTTNHAWDGGVVTKQPTATEKGEKTYTCKVCKATKKEAIAALGAPKKGAVAKSDKATYKVTKSDLKNGTAAYVGPLDKSATKVTIPETVKIDGVTFKVTSIEKNAFKNNKKVKTVTIGKNVSKIGAKAFYGCSKLKTLKIKTTKLTAKKIGSKAFSKTPKSMKVTIPKKKFKTYKSMLIKRGVNKKAKFKKS